MSYSDLCDKIQTQDAAMLGQMLECGDFDLLHDEHYQKIWTEAFKGGPSVLLMLFGYIHEVQFSDDSKGSYQRYLHKKLSPIVDVISSSSQISEIITKFRFNEFDGISSDEFMDFQSVPESIRHSSDDAPNSEEEHKSFNVKLNPPE